MSNNRYTVPCKVTGNALAESKEKRTPSVKLALLTQDENPRTLYADLWLTDATFDATVETLESVFGWSGMKLEELNEPILVGIEVDAVCEVETYQGQNGTQEREVVKFINAPGSGGGVKKMEAAQVSAVVSRLDALLARARSNRPSGSRRPSAPRAPQGPNDFPGFAPAEGF